MSKLEKREEIINDYNSAQSVLETIVDSVDFSINQQIFFKAKFTYHFYFI